MGVMKASMDQSNENKRRRSTRLVNWDYFTPGAYSVTVCAYKRQFLFGEVVDEERLLDEVGVIIEKNPLNWFLDPNHPTE